MIQFSIDNPDIAVLAVSIEGMDGLQQALLTAGADADVFVVAAPGAYAGVRDKGFAASLNDSAALMTKARQLHPAVQEALFAGDQLLAYPVAVQAYSWTVNQTLWERFALGEYPRTYAELFAGLARWEDEHAQDNPEYRFIDMQENLAGYVAALVREYILQNERADAPLSFDTPAFREALGCIIENRYLIEDVAEQSGMPLLFSYSMGYGVGSNDGEKTVMLLPPTLSGDDQQALCVNLEVLALNPASQHKAEAIRFIEYAAERMDISMQYMIDPSLNTPVRPEGYETRAAQLAEEIAEMEDQAKTAEDSETSGLEDALANKRAVLEAMEREQWLISQESIDNYQELAEHLRAPYATLFLTNEPNSGWETLAPIIQRYCDQGLDEGAIGAFVQELDRVAGMIFAERM
jgi:ABC-type glycerol-3-phosphate transport system substrate-binding protein